MTSKFNIAEIMKAAWNGYRKMARDMRETGFNRSRFNFELRLAWTKAKARLPVRFHAASIAPVAVTPRVAAIRAEIFDLQMSDFMDWRRHGRLQLELSRAIAA